MFIKSDIRKVTIALEKALGHEVYIRLGQEGIIHLARVQAGDTLTDAGIVAEEGRTRDIIAGSGFVLSALKIEAGERPCIGKACAIRAGCPICFKGEKDRGAFAAPSRRIQEEAAIVAEQLEYAEALSRWGLILGR